MRFRAQRRGLRLLVAVRRAQLPAYEGSVAGLLPILADRQAKELARELPGFRLRTEGKARVNDAPGYQLRYRADDVTNGIDILVVPEDGDREGVLLRFRQSNPPRALGAAAEGPREGGAQGLPLVPLRPRPAVSIALERWGPGDLRCCSAWSATRR